MSMGKYGIRASQSGIPIDRAADWQETIDDRWPVVEFVTRQVFTVQYTSPSAGSLIFMPLFQHALGYLPGFIIKGISLVQANGDPITLSGGNNATFDQVAVADEQYVYLPFYKTSGQSVSLVVKFFLAVVDRDLNQTFAADIQVPTASDSTTASPYGLKIQTHPSGQGMDDKDKSKYTFNSNAKSLAVQAHGKATAQTSGTYNGYVQVPHYLGYPPTYFLSHYFTQTGAVNPFLNKVHVTAFGYTSYRATADTNFLLATGGQGSLAGDFMYLILKDPVGLAR